MNKVELKKDVKEGKKINVTCRECKRSTKHKILSDITRNGYYFKDLEDNYSWTNEFQIVECQGCETISFRATHEDSEAMEEIADNQWGPVISEDIYPNPEEGRSLINDRHVLPVSLQRIYSETIKSINGAQPVLTGIGIRAIVETVCKDKNASGSDLFQKINNLVTQGVLTKDGAEILHKLRTLGNEAAHEVKPHDSVQLGLALDVIEHLMQGVYILPHHAKAKFK